MHYGGIKIVKKIRQSLLGIGIVLSFGFLALGTFKIIGHMRGSIQSNKKMVFKLAEVHDEDYPTSIANQKFADLVKEKTEGRIQIEIYTSGLLGDENSVIKEMQKGTIAFGRLSIAPLAEYVDQLYVLMLPYLYRDSRHMWRVLESHIGDEMLDSLGEAGLIGLTWYDSGARSFYLKEGSLDEKGLNGKRIRVQKNSLMYAMCEALGAKPQFLPESEMYHSMLDVSLDGAENNIPTYENYEQYKVYNYYILDEHTRIPEVLAVSNEVMKKLSEKDQQIIREAAKEAGAYERILWSQREEESIKRLKEKGVKFVTISDETEANLKKACESLYDEFGRNYQDIIQQIESMKEE